MNPSLAKRSHLFMLSEKSSKGNDKGTIMETNKSCVEATEFT
jgi:hypothetical protein